MCTVSFMPTPSGFYLAMNRDEQKSRTPGLPPRLHSVGVRSVLHPSEPTGGTWIGVNDLGLVFALVNWYEKTQPNDKDRVSRGVVVKDLLMAENLPRARKIIKSLPLPQLNPFRVVAISSRDREIKEWRWDGHTFDALEREWKRQHWFSSGYDEPEARRVREIIVEEAARSKSSGTLEWLRRLHRSHRPKPGPLSICMHRNDARTVSYTEIRVTSHHATMSYVAGAPCHQSKLFLEKLALGVPTKLAVVE